MSTLHDPQSLPNQNFNIRNWVHTIILMSLIAVLGTLIKMYIFGEASLVPLAEPYTIRMVSSINERDHVPYRIVYIEEGTKLRKTLSVFYNEEDRLDDESNYMYKDWKKLLKQKVIVIHDLPPNSYPYVDVYPEKYTTGNILSGAYEYNRMEFHMSMPRNMPR